MVDFLARQDLRRIYDRHLMELVSRKSLFTDDAGIREALGYCRDVIAATTHGRRSVFDVAGNLISVSERFDAARPAVYLSAHIDTVDADPCEWRSVADPFRAVETATHIIGRGANDCKAGVAFMLLCCAAQEFLSLDNVVLLFSHREEGNQKKTSVQIGKDLGVAIPLSGAENVLLCLENTVKLEGERFFLDIYDAEPCNVFISFTEPVSCIREFLTAHPEWKPVFIKPVEDVSQLGISSSLSGVSGHVATVRNDENVIYQAIFSGRDCCLSGGDCVQTSVIHNHVDIYD